MLGLIKGMTDTTFEPSNPTTRAMFVTIFARMSKDNIDGYNANNFADVKETDWFYKSVAWAAANGIVKGTSATTFDPNKEITREEMAVIMIRYLAYKGLDTRVGEAKMQYSDSTEIADWAKTGVEFCSEKGLLKGYDGNEFKPKKNATRAEVTTVATRMHSFKK